ncbi:MAG TPA: glycosyltransferase family 9 protein [Verrucomicrobiae bacterium]|nr:glycosyltransferase family 9 protein [Verrucomicrobiae bacterium]
MNWPENILLIRLKSIGDILFALPAVHVVRDNFPNAKLHFLTSKEFAPLVRGFADVDEIIPLDRSVYRAGNFQNAAAGTFQFLRQLTEINASLAIDFQGYSETEWLAWWSGATERWGNVYKKSRGWTFTQTSWREVTTHPAEWNLTLLRRCGLKAENVRNEFHLPDDALEKARRFFFANKLDLDKRTIFIQPFTSNPQKNWPLENFLELARHFRQRSVQIIFGGGAGDREKLAPVVAAGFPVSAGAPLLVSGGIAKLSTLVIGADTGLLHFSVAMGKRVVMLMYSNAPGTSHPFQHADWAITPANGNVVAEIKTGAVIESAERALAESI